MNSFEELDFSKDIKKAIKEMGFTNPTEIQRLATPAILAGDDVLGLAPTGSGKTLAFAVGLIDKIDPESKNTEALILCPTRELVMQTTNVIKELAKYKEGVRILAIFGGQNMDRQILLLKKKPQIIIATPGRCIDHLNRRTIKLHNLNTLVLDEADEMLDLGFRDDLDKILKTAGKNRQTLLFSATMSDEINRITKEYQQNAITIKGNVEASTPKIKQTYLYVKDSNQKDETIMTLLKNSSDLSIIFCNTKKRVDSLKRLLISKGHNVEALHGDMSQNHRYSVMKLFKANKLTALITTDVAARGIDVNDIKRVINYDFPNDPKYYIHRIGRTARAGKDGVSITFITNREEDKFKELEKELKMKIPEFKADYLKSNKKEKQTNDSTRLFISLGKFDKITGTILKDFIIETGKVKPSDISDIEVFDKFSFFNINNNKLDKILIRFKGIKYGQRRIGIEISNHPNSKFKRKRK